jgi:hypothetical protein
VKKSKLFWESAFDFLSARDTVGRMEEWGATFTAILHIVDVDMQHRLHAVLRDLTISELVYGHITSLGGLKIIQSTHARPFGPQFVHELEVDGPARRRRNSWEDGFPNDRFQGQLRGWREIGFLLQLAPPTAETLELMTRALDVHERPLAHTFAEILKRFNRLEVEGWLESLLVARQARQILALDILSTLVRSSSSFWEYLASVLRRYTDDPAAPEIVAAKALRILRDVIDSQLSREIVALFHRPDLRSIRTESQRDAWRVGLSAATSCVAHPQQKAESRLPALGPTAFPLGVVNSSSVPRKIMLVAALPHSPARRPMWGHPT